MPTIVSWPAVQTGPARVSWDTVVTMDFMATMMDYLSIDRPETQKDWGFDGRSILPILRGEQWPEREIGYVFQHWNKNTPHGYRYGKWKWVQGSQSCQATDCKEDMLFDLEQDLGEKNNIAAQFPDVLEAIKANWTMFFDSVTKSRNEESLCGDPPSPPPTPPTPPSPSPPPSDGCDWHTNTGLIDSDMGVQVVETKEECCDLCKATEGCIAADFKSAYVGTMANPAGVFIETMEDDLHHVVVESRCHLKKAYNPISRSDGSMACVLRTAEQLV